MSRTRKFSMRDHPETSEVEVGGEGDAVTLPVSADEALAHAKLTSTLKDQLNKEPLRVLMHKVILPQGSLPQSPGDRLMSNSKLHM